MMNSIKKNFMYNSVYQIMIMIIPLITTPYISRTIGPEGVGMYSYSFSIAQYYVLFIMLGLNNYGNRTIAMVKDNNELLSTTFCNIYTMQVALGIIINSVYLIYSFFIAENFNITIIMGIYVLSACFDINWFFFGLEKFKSITVRNIIIKIITTVMIFIFVKEKNDIYVYCFIMVIGIILSQLVLWPYACKIISFKKPTWNGIKIHIKPNLVLFLTVLAVSLFKIMDKIMLGVITNTQQVGFYESSERVITIPTALVTSLGTVMLPRMSNMFANNSEKTSTFLYKSILLAMFLSTSMSFGIMSVAKVFVPIFYGSGYEQCINLFLVLLPSCIFFAFGNVIRTQYLLPKKMDRVYVISGFLGAFVNIVINLLLIPQFGALGAAIGTFFAEAVVCIYQSYMVRMFVDLKKYIKKSMPFLFSGLGMFLFLYNFNFFIDNQIILLIVMIIVGIFVYFGLLLLQIVITRIVFKKRLF